jgi:hypothetical protein
MVPDVRGKGADVLFCRVKAICRRYETLGCYCPRVGVTLGEGEISGCDSGTFSRVSA